MVRQVHEFTFSKRRHHGTGSDMAQSFASLPQTSMHVGAIAVMSREAADTSHRLGIDASGNPIIISGNHGHRVREAVYRVVASMLSWCRDDFQRAF